MRVLPLFLLLSVVPATAQRITVRAASGSEVALSWTGPASAAWIVERARGNGAYSAVGESSVRMFKDTGIDPMAVYRYRVRSKLPGYLSAEATVGPPPGGMHKMAMAPKNAVNRKGYGVRSSLALDESGDPAAAFLVQGGAGNEIWFVRWSRAAYRWRDPVKVAAIGAVELDGLEPFSLAFDRSSGVAAIAFPRRGEDGVTVAFSRDGGRTWLLEHFQTGLETSAVSAALAMHKGKLHLVANMEGRGPVYIAGEVGAPATAWTSEPVPPAGQQHHDHSNVALVLGSDEVPMIGFADLFGQGGGLLYAVWRPGAAGSVSVADTGGAAEEFPDVALTLGGGRFGMLFAARRDFENRQAGVWFSGSADGIEWSPPVKAPVSGPRSSNRPLALASGSRGALAASFGSSQGTGGAACAYPQTALSVDGAVWRPCGLTDPVEDNPVDPQPETIRAVYGAGDKLWVLANSGDDVAGFGLFLWRQP